MQKQRYFLYKEVSDILIEIAVRISPCYAHHIITRLKTVLVNTHDRRQRAISESIGALPIHVAGPKIYPQTVFEVLDLKFDGLFKIFGTSDLKHFAWHGRTLRVSTGKGEIGCIKFAKSKADLQLIELEVQWLCYLGSDAYTDTGSFHIPYPVIIENHGLFRITDLPECLQKKALMACPAIIFKTQNDYYRYPDKLFDSIAPQSAVKTVFSKNAYLLGRMTATGIVHTAVIPLFHNRIQQARRNDNGVYLWEHGGRLDRWLESCKYPNFSASGLRDFEHLISVSDSCSLHHYIGEHILSFILVLGSLFRSLAPDRIGHDATGKPIDLRYLFDAELFFDILFEVLCQYYKGVTGRIFKNQGTLLDRDLIEKLINVMGIDTHMEEILRVRDQLSIDDSHFNTFLLSRGYTKKEAEKLTKDKEDIILTSGPHLGGFNQSISIPELIEFLFGFSSLCLADRYLDENGLKG